MKTFGRDTPRPTGHMLTHNEVINIKKLSLENLKFCCQSIEQRINKSTNK